MPAARVDIFRFVDFRLYLRSFYEAEKSNNPKFSQRFIQQKVGASSSGWFADVIQNRIQLSGTHFLRLSRLLELEPHEEEYFDTMVRFSQAGTFEEKNKYYAKLLSFKELQVDLVDRDGFEYFSHWYHAAIRELLFLIDFKGDFSALARKLSPPIRTEDARRSVRLLEKLGFIKKDAQGCLRPTTAILKKDPTFKSIYLGNFLKSNISLAVEALDRFDKEERDISALTLTLSDDDLQTAKAEIKLLRKKLLQMSEKSEKRNRVYQCNFQIFPVSE
jgi:uncharacterized protein (TIGR02147 family)